MADAACAVQSFCHRPDATEIDGRIEEQYPENTYSGLESSISFGRFVSESLDWGKFSSFRQNRYIEEVEKSSKPGSVAQMKAHFEAHFKRVAAMKAAAKTAQENSNLTTVSEQPQFEVEPGAMDLQISSEHRTELDEVQTAAIDESSLKILPQDAETNELKRSEEKETVAEGFNDDGENQGLDEISDSSPSRSKPPTKPPLQESFAANREIPASSSKGKKQNSTFISSKWSLFGQSSTVSPSPGNPKKKETPLNPSKAQTTRYPRTAIQTTPSSSKSTPAQNPTRSSSLKSTPAKKATPSQENHTRSSPRSEVQGTCTPSQPRSKKVSVTSQSFSTSCWNSSRSIWKKPVQVVCSPFKFKSEERAQKRREFYLKLEEKLKAEKLEAEMKAKENAEEELRKLRQNLGFKARPMPGFYQRPKN